MQRMERFKFLKCLKKKPKTNIQGRLTKKKKLHSPTSNLWKSSLLSDARHFAATPSETSASQESARHTKRLDVQLLFLCPGCSPKAISQGQVRYRSMCGVRSTCVTEGHIHLGLTSDGMLSKKHLALS